MWLAVILVLLNFCLGVFWKFRLHVVRQDKTWETEIVTVRQVPVKVVCFGGVTPSRLIKHPESKPEDLILIIPGNPGLTSFYLTFAKNLFLHSNKPTWIVSHGGHENLPCPPLNSNRFLYTSRGQTVQKEELIETYLRGVKLWCIGHSIGAHIVLNLLKTSCGDQIIRAYLLFPSIENLALTRYGKRLRFVLRYVKCAALGLCHVFQLFPRPFQRYIIASYCYITSVPYDNIQAIIELLEPRVLNKIFFLSNSDLENIYERDDETIKKNVEKLKFCYGMRDGWAPIENAYDLKEKIPNLHVEIDEIGISHQFMMRSYSVPAAKMLTSWIEADSSILSDAEAEGSETAIDDTTGGSTPIEVEDSKTATGDNAADGDSQI